MTKVFVAGATGVVGKRAVEQLVEAGHQVTAVSRSEEKDELLRRLGARPVRVDLFDAAAVTAAVAEAAPDAVVNLTTAIPPSSQALRAKAWELNDRIRRDVSRHLVDAALASGAQRFVQESITFNYADGGDRWLDEDSPVRWGRQGATCAVAEEQAARFTAAGGTGVVLRFGVFYGLDGHHMADLRRLLVRRVAPHFSPDGYISSVSTEDAGAAVVAALGVPAGIYNVVDDEPVSRREWVDAAASALDTGRPRFLMRAMLPMVGRRIEMMLRSQRVSNARFKAVSGWAPRYPSVREGFVAVLRAGEPAEPVASGR